jgi:hypothetical protein
MALHFLWVSISQSTEYGRRVGDGRKSIGRVQYTTSLARKTGTPLAPASEPQIVAERLELRGFTLQ